MTPDPAKPHKPRGKSHPSLQCHNWPDWVADGAVRSYPVSAKRYFFSLFSISPPFFAARVVRQCSEYSEKPRCPHRSICFLYSDLTDAVTCWLTHTSSTGGRSSRNRICFNQLFYTAISTSLTPERQPCRKPSGGGSGPLLIVVTGFTSHRRTFHRREHLSGYRSRQARVGASGASDSWLETIRNRAKQALSVQFGTIWGLIVSIFALNRADNEKTLNPRSRLRRRRIAEFELVKPRIHPAEFYGGNEDDSADGPVQGAIRVWKP